MRPVGIVVATLVWIACWLVAPASWWLNARVLDEAAFQATMREVLQIDDVDAQIAERATTQVVDEARRFVERTVPVLAPQADALLDSAQPLIAGAVDTAVTSEPGERALLAMSAQMHNAFVAWVEADTLGQPGLEADLADGRVRFDVDQLLAGETVAVGPVTVPLDVLDLPGLSVPVPLPPDWLRTPLLLVRDALLPALVGIGVCGVALVWLDRGRGRALAVASGVAALCVGAGTVAVRASWSLSGADSADWTLTRALGDLLVAPLLSAGSVVAGLLVALMAGSLLADRLVVRRRRA